RVIEGPEICQRGGRGRIAAGIYDVLGQEGELLGLSPAQVKTIKTQDQDEFFKRPFWSSVKGFGLSTWKSLSLKAVDRGSAKIDTVVTTDVHRLIRLPGTLNGHTGLLTMDVPRERLDECDPFGDSRAIHGARG